MNKIEMIVSGGQTGADQGGLVAGRKLGIKTFGYAPKGYKTEDGYGDIDKMKSYGLIESDSSDYVKRTIQNLKLADGTIVFATDIKSTGTKLTINSCKRAKKPILILDLDKSDHTETIRNFIISKNLKSINIAGNRESKSKGLRVRTARILIAALRNFKYDERIIYVDRLSVELCRENKMSIYVFGDNMIGKGKASQACIRDEINSFGIPTKKLPSMMTGSFLEDTLEERKIIRGKLLELCEWANRGYQIVFPRDGLGTGLARMELYAPNCFNYMNEAIDKIFIKYNK